jgi:hypothetical protein
MPTRRSAAQISTETKEVNIQFIVQDGHPATAHSENLTHPMPVPTRRDPGHHARRRVPSKRAPHGSPAAIVPVICTSSWAHIHKDRHLKWTPSSRPSLGGDKRIRPGNRSVRGPRLAELWELKAAAAPGPKGPFNLVVHLRRPKAAICCRRRGHRPHRNLLVEHLMDCSHPQSKGRSLTAQKPAYQALYAGAVRCNGVL